MLYIFTGDDRSKVRAAIHKEIGRLAKNDYEIMRVTDVHALSDVHAALQGGGMFTKAHVVVFENVLQNEDMRQMVLDSLEVLQSAAAPFFILEEKVDAATRKRLERHEEKIERFDSAKESRDSAVFELAHALRRGDKKALWIGYMRERAKGSAPEMIHGILFWAAKQQFLKAENNTLARVRATATVVALAELPHEARRKGFDFECALERFVLSNAW